MPPVVCRSEEKVVLWLFQPSILQPRMPSQTLARASARMQASLDKIKRGAIGRTKPRGNKDALPPCVDCGDRTQLYCDYCKAADRMPSQQWGENQGTPLCYICNRFRNGCHFCKDEIRDWPTVKRKRKKETGLRLPNP